jgi:hypothetical protein
MHILARQNRHGHKGQPYPFRRAGPCGRAENVGGGLGVTCRLNEFPLSKDRLCPRNTRNDTNKIRPKNRRNWSHQTVWLVELRQRFFIPGGSDTPKLASAWLERSGERQRAEASRLAGARRYVGRDNDMSGHGCSESNAPGLFTLCFRAVSHFSRAIGCMDTAQR